MDDNAMSNLHLALADLVLSSVAKKESAKEIWDAFTRLYKVRLLHNKIFLKRRLYTLRITESTSMIDHINNLNTLFSQLSVLDHNIAVNECAKILFQSLPDSYNQLIINLTNNVLTNYAVFDEVVVVILEEESKCKNREDRLASS
ncbi:hypothetical protein Patl1_10272 [Pistacia atlantica]|uniref:Uncharacterized protein n=1 Tax=Pistacia atlantica TaxID=434234 RepID=A0ACC1A822_9ROSI|nr:hypothetical protein Patl1_10272 [Pistacia atlantica]